MQSGEPKAVPLCAAAPDGPRAGMRVQEHHSHGGRPLHLWGRSAGVHPRETQCALPLPSFPPCSTLNFSHFDRFSLTWRETRILYLVVHLLYMYCIRINTRGAILSCVGLSPDEPHTRTFISVDFFSLLFIVQWDHCLLNLIVCHCDVYSLFGSTSTFFYCSLFNVQMYSKPMKCVR